ncbi:hypothetical protein [Variovorax saccharolyticus]|uniref:hypothetical protein n=1 Tax=Variovorax saccharolyticus TaxID=3053516 RepID=UPI0025765E19|nr:hypothetical protein [Variovorax sp. J22R187]MDM0022653.1 hypothetical protein [Variovorax sp. J22R187]
MNRGPLRVKAPRRKADLAPEGDLGVLMAHADRLQEVLEATGQCDLSDEQRPAVPAPATDSIGGKSIWSSGSVTLCGCPSRLQARVGRAEPENAEAPRRSAPRWRACRRGHGGARARDWRIPVAVEVVGELPREAIAALRLQRVRKNGPRLKRRSNRSDCALEDPMELSPLFIGVFGSKWLDDFLFGSVAFAVFVATVLAVSALDVAEQEA